MNRLDGTPQIQPEQRMTILVFGAGAIGTYVGGSLALLGNSVTFLEQPGAADQVATQGLILNLKDHEHHIQHPSVVNNLPEAWALGPYDVAIFALKSFDTQVALSQMAHFKKELPPFLCLQNGVENEQTLGTFLGQERVIAGTVTSAVGRRGIGNIVLERLRGIGIAANHPLSERLHRHFNLAGLNPRLYTNPGDMKWSKMLTNLLANATSAILDMSPAAVFAHPGLYQLEIDQLREALRVMHALGFHVADLPATPVRALAFAVKSLPVALSRPVLSNAVGGGRGGKMPSFHIDLHSRRGQSEVDYLNGAIVRFGEKSGVPTPVNRLLNQTLLSLISGDLPLDTYKAQPNKLLKQLGA